MEVRDIGCNASQGPETRNRNKKNTVDDEQVGRHAITWQLCDLNMASQDDVQIALQPISFTFDERLCY